MWPGTQCGPLGERPLVATTQMSLKGANLGASLGRAAKVIIIKDGYYSLGKAKEEFPEDSPLPCES